MANEIKYGMQLNLTNGLLSDSYTKSGLTDSQTNARLVRAVQEISNVGTAGYAVDLVDVVAPKVGVFTNMDSVNYIEIGIQVSGTFYPFMKLLAGQSSGPVFLSTLAPYALANTAVVKLFYVIYDS